MSAEQRQAVHALVMRVLLENRHIEPTVTDICALFATPRVDSADLTEPFTPTELADVSRWLSARNYSPDCDSVEAQMWRLLKRALETVAVVRGDGATGRVQGPTREQIAEVIRGRYVLGSAWPAECADAIEALYAPLRTENAAFRTQLDRVGEDAAMKLADVERERDTLRQRVGELEEENATLRAREEDDEILHGKLVAEVKRDRDRWEEMYREQDGRVANLLAQIAETEVETMRQALLLRAADHVMRAIDVSVSRGFLDSRGPIADARLDYGDPHRYEAKENEKLAEAQRTIERLVLLDAERVGYISALKERLIGLVIPAPTQEPRDG